VKSLKVLSRTIDIRVENRIECVPNRQEKFWPLNCDDRYILFRYGSLNGVSSNFNSTASIDVTMRMLEKLRTKFINSMEPCPS
jgi:hypothetical protein